MHITLIEVHITVTKHTYYVVEHDNRLVGLSLPAACIAIIVVRPTDSEQRQHTNNDNARLN